SPPLHEAVEASHLESLETQPLIEAHCRIERFDVQRDGETFAISVFQQSIHQCRPETAPSLARNQGDIHATHFCPSRLESRPADRTSFPVNDEPMCPGVMLSIMRPLQVELRAEEG